MLNLYKILALGMIVTKARISFQLVMPVLLFPHVGVRAAWYQKVQGLLTVYTYDQSCSIWNYTRRTTPVKIE